MRDGLRLVGRWPWETGSSRMVIAGGGVGRTGDVPEVPACSGGQYDGYVGRERGTVRTAATGDCEWDLQMTRGAREGDREWAESGRRG